MCLCVTRGPGLIGKAAQAINCARGGRYSKFFFFPSPDGWLCESPKVTESVYQKTHPAEPPLVSRAFWLDMRDVLMWSHCIKRGNRMLFLKAPLGCIIRKPELKREGPLQEMRWTMWIVWRRFSTHTRTCAGLYCVNFLAEPCVPWSNMEHAN